MDISATDSKNARTAETFFSQFPYMRSVRMRRDLMHFDSWLKAISDETIDSPFHHSYIYKCFLLCNIELYRCAVTRDRFIPDDLECDLQLSGLLDGSTFSCRQAFARVVSFIRWQRYQYNVDTQELMRELIPFYRRLCEMTRSKELTYKSAQQSERILNVFRLHSVPGPQPERDRLILLMTWGVGCPPDELAKLSSEDFEILGPVQWVYIRPNAKKEPIKLDHMTALCVIDLITKNEHLKGFEPDVLLNCRDGLAWRPLTEGDIEVILERYYRFAGTLYGFDDYTNPTGRLTPDLLPREEALFTKALRTITKQILAIHRQPHRGKDENDDWDAAVRKNAGRQTAAEHETTDADEEDQADWDIAITKSK